MKYKYEYRSAIFPDEDEVFDTKEEFLFYFRDVASPLFKIFVEDEEIDFLHIGLGPEDYKLYRIYK